MSESKCDLLRARKNHYQNKYSIAGYTIEGLAAIAQELDFEGRRVLEFGGWNIPTEITLQDLAATSWTCVDMIGSISGTYQKRRFAHLEDVSTHSYEQGAELLGKQRFLVIDGDATQLPEPFFEQFDVVISFAALEHVLDVPTFIDKAYRALRPEGVFACRFGPLWSCHIGHHAYVSPEINFQKDGPIGDWGHLLHTPPEMHRKLLDMSVTSEDAAKTVTQLYTSPRINRIFAEDFRAFFDTSKFGPTQFRRVWGKEPSTDTFDRLKQAHPRYEDFTTGSWQTVSRKPSSR